MSIPIKYLFIYLSRLFGQEGWILAGFFSAFLWNETKSRSIKMEKRNKANIRHFMNRTSFDFKGFIIWPRSRKREFTFAEQKREIPENRKKDSLLLAFSRTQPFKPFNKHAY